MRLKNCSEIEKMHCGGAIELSKGRTEFAVAKISGEENVSGTARFYYTPLGMLVYVTVSGLDEIEEVYSLEITTLGGGVCTLPPLYNRNGGAWSSALTGKISACDIFGGRIRITRKGSTDKNVAVGSICPPRIEAAQLLEAE